MLGGGRNSSNKPTIGVSSWGHRHWPRATDAFNLRFWPLVGCFPRSSEII